MSSTNTPDPIEFLNTAWQESGLHGTVQQIHVSTDLYQALLRCWKNGSRAKLDMPLSAGGYISQRGNRPNHGWAVTEWVMDEPVQVDDVDFS